MCFIAGLINDPELVFADPRVGLEFANGLAGSLAAVLTPVAVNHAICVLVFLYLSVSAFSAITSVIFCQLFGNGTFGDFALITQSWALFSASVKTGFFMYIFMPGYLCFL